MTNTFEHFGQIQRLMRKGNKRMAAAKRES
jgi:hypothetical protein